MVWCTPARPVRRYRPGMTRSDLEWNRPFLSATAGGDRCVPNIGPKQRAMRRNFGILMFGVGAGAAVALILTGVAPAVRLLLFLPFAAGATSWYQAVEHT